MDIRNLLIKKITEAISDCLGQTNSEANARELGLYLGMEHPSADKQFWERLRTAPNEKRNLGKYLCRHEPEGLIPSLTWKPKAASVGRNTDTIFFESGSTICPAIGQFANALADPLQKDFIRPQTVYTNNIFAITALVNLVKHVIPIEGSFQTRYCGFFPFAERDDAPAHDPTNKEPWEREVFAYARIKSLIGKCNTVIGTCSNFSFLAGPLVGGRANAITKHAMYVGKDPNAEFVLLMHFAKIMPIKNRSNSKFRSEEPRDTCYSIFPKHPNLVLPKDASGWHSKWNTATNQDIATEFSKGVANIDRFNLPAALPLPDFQKSWCDISERVRILVSLPEDNLDEALGALREEATIANRILGHFGLCYDIHRANDNDFISKHKVVEIEVRSGSCRS